MLPYETLRQSLSTQLFDSKTWQFSPEPFRLTARQVAEIESIGDACLAYHRALEKLYLNNAQVAAVLDRGKPPPLVRRARDERNRDKLPSVLRPDLLITEDGFAMTELDSVPGGIGLTAFLNRLYEGQGKIIGEGDAMIRHFHQSLAALCPGKTDPNIAIVVSEEAATYRPEMQWLAAQLPNTRCVAPENFNADETDILYRFFELFDLPNIPNVEKILNAIDAGQVAVAPPLRPFQEEKLGFAFFHDGSLSDFWRGSLGENHFATLQKIIPQTWLVDDKQPPSPDKAPLAKKQPVENWRQLVEASQRERNLILKISGFHESAWGARSVTYGSDSSRVEWQAAVELALNSAEKNPFILQRYAKPVRTAHPLYDSATGQVAVHDGRTRLCPYFFIIGERARLSGILATFCPPDKKLIHGMSSAALLPCAAV